jgi:hypothetical protein
MFESISDIDLLTNSTVRDEFTALVSKSAKKSHVCSL